MTEIYLVVDFIDPRRDISTRDGYNQTILMATLDKKAALNLAKEQYQDNLNYYNNLEYEDHVYVLEYEDYGTENVGAVIFDSAEYKTVEKYEDEDLPIDIDGDEEEDE